MALAFVKLYHTFLEETAMLTDTELAHLVRAMLLHARGESVPEALLSGNERYQFPRWQMQIDRDNAAYAKRCESNRQNALKGGRPKKEAPPKAASPNPALDYAQRDWTGEDFHFVVS